MVQIPRFTPALSRATPVTLAQLFMLIVAVMLTLELCMSMWRSMTALSSQTALEGMAEQLWLGKQIL
jgi:hypothetical protein